MTENKKLGKVDKVVTWAFVIVGTALIIAGFVTLPKLDGNEFLFRLFLVLSTVIIVAVDSLKLVRNRRAIG
jgi:hypothetical protein